ncbi:hypothetical protein [Metabacillus indicus]|uniref:hypothetical protein n=1 Tax=Metabacillus indicus TaxID=246786 RepID=UPI0004937A29|nr:hypothetical protein [Metabacillus indicus]KEZ48767.1 hypothetical protein AZ46_0217905 [Metabacillus indicus LMG 22858]
MMKKIYTSICLIAVSSLILSGCIKLKTLEVEPEAYKSFAKELSYYGIGLGESRKVVSDKLGKPDEAEDSRYLYSDEKLELQFDRSRIMTLMSSKDPGFKTKENIHVGDTKNKLIRKYEDFDFLEIATNQGAVVYFVHRDQNVFFYIGSDNKIKEIVLSDPELPIAEAMDFMTSFDLEPSLAELENEDIIKNSKPVALDLGLEENKEKLLSDEFMDYAKASLFPEAPVPIGMSEEDLIMNNGSPGLIDEEEDYKWYFYKKMKVFFGINEEDKVEQIKAYVKITKDELSSAYSLREEGNKVYIQLPEDYPVTAYVQFATEDTGYLYMKEK